MAPPAPFLVSTAFRPVSTSPSACLRLLRLSLKPQSPAAKIFFQPPNVSCRSSSTASEASSTPSSLPPPKPRSRFRRFIGFTSLAVFAFSAGLAYQTSKTVSRMMTVTDEETLTAFKPTDAFSREVDEFIRTHPLTVSLREDPAFTESRPHMKIPEALRARNLTAGTLMRPDGITVPPYIFCEEGGKSLVAIFYLGPGVSGHPGIVHGGLLATLLDEAMGRCCFPALPNQVGVTANLNVDYRAPAMAGTYSVLRAETVRVEGRKAWVEGRIETLPQNEGEEPKTLVEAKALFVEPKQAAAMSSLYKVTN